jgi:anti-sigma B factor antagonist
MPALAGARNRVLPGRPMFCGGQPCASHVTSLRPGRRLGLLRLAALAKVAAMSDSYPVQWAGRRATVTLPQHVAEFNASRIREELLQVISRGAAELVMDMTGTAWCDYEGATAVARAHQRAVASGTQLRLAVAAETVRRVLTLNGLDRLIPIYRSLEDAIAAAATAATVSVRLQPDVQHAAQPHEPIGSGGSSPVRTGVWSGPVSTGAVPGPAGNGAGLLGA